MPHQKNLGQHHSLSRVTLILLLTQEKGQAANSMENQQATGNVDAVAPSIMTIFGVTGDLTKRLLLPSLYNLAAIKVLPDKFRLLGVAKEDWNEAKLREHIGEALKEFWGAEVDGKIVEWLQGRAGFQQADFDDPESFDAVKNAVEKTEKDAQLGGNRLFYLAVAPSFIGTMAAQLARTGLIREEEGDNACWRRLVIEKPFGHDLDSAVQLNRDLQGSLREDQIYRIDHFAGKDTVQDLAAFRFSNSIFEPLWNRSLVDNIQITVAETVGVEMRAGYYEHAGALRDMVPNHLAEVLSLVAMEPPVSFSAEHIRSKQVELLQSIRKWKPEEVAANAVRGQYAAGTLQDKPVVAYRNEPDVAEQSETETYVAFKVEIDNWRWSGVPFYLRTGKRLAKAATEVIVTFRQSPAQLHPGADTGGAAPNVLFFNLQPTPGIQLQFGTKKPGLQSDIEKGVMSFAFPQGPFGAHVKGYERLLYDVMVGNPMLFQRADFVEEGWRMVEPLIHAWEQPVKDAGNALASYASGSNGPEAADKLLAASGHTWYSLEQA